MRDQESVTGRRLKGDNVMSGICHDFTHLCGDKVTNVNDRCWLDVQNASPTTTTVIVHLFPCRLVH